MKSTMLFCYGVITFASFWVSYVEAAQIILNGKTLQMAADHWDPWFITPEVSGSPSYSGVMWRSPDENGVWGGMVGIVKGNEVDFALGPTHLSHFARGTCCKTFLISQ